MNKYCHSAFTHSAFTILELLISITIMGIMASMITLSADYLLRSNARQEAGKIAFFLSRAMRKADRWHHDFVIILTPASRSKSTTTNVFQIKWEKSNQIDSVQLSSGFSVSCDNRRLKEIRYHWGSFEPSLLTLTVKNDYSNHLVILNGGIVSTKSPD